MENGAREDGRGWSPVVLSMSLFRPASTSLRAGSEVGPCYGYGLGRRGEGAAGD